MSDRTRYRSTTAALVVIGLELITWLLMALVWWLVLARIDAFRWDRPEMLRYLFIGPVLVLLFLADMAWRNRALR